MSSNNPDATLPFSLITISLDNYSFIGGDFDAEEFACANAVGCVIPTKQHIVPTTHSPHGPFDLEGKLSVD